MTRVADITGLDRIGLPVWQAVRPAGKALSVHQGKGSSAVAAKIGALAEAIESHCAESVAADGPVSTYGALAAESRAPELSDYARRREAPPADEPVAWCRAEERIGGGAFWLPHDLVSLDFTEPRSSLFDRSSAGLGLGADEDAALETSLLEVIERDCVGDWQRRPFEERMRGGIAAAGVGYDWFGAWRERLAGLGVELRLFAPAAVVEVPVAIVWIGGGEAFGEGWRSFSGSACDPDPETALFKALAEALQSRLTFVAGVRDDILPSHYAGPGAPLPPSAAHRRWEDIRGCARGWKPLSERLAAHGYDRLAVKSLGAGLEGIAVTKAFVPGLGSLKRTRRAPR